MADPRQRAERPARPSRPSRAPVPLHILVVDDETAILELLARYFTTRGHTVVTTPNGSRAIELAQHQPFDVVICDLRMPGLDGREVIRQLRTLANCRGARYIVSTGDSTAITGELAEAGAATILVKPYDIDALRHTVEHPVAPDAH